MSIRPCFFGVRRRPVSVSVVAPSTTYPFDSGNYAYDEGDYTTSMHLTWELTLDNPLLAGCRILPGF